MRLLTVAAVSSAFALTLMAAESKDQVTAAAKKLVGQNYSWTSLTKMEGSQFTARPLEGMADKDGFMCVKQEFNNNSSEAFLKGTKGVVKTDDGWKTAEELTQAAGDGQGRGRGPGRMLLNVKAPAEAVLDLVGKVKELKAGEAGMVSGDLTEAGAQELLTAGRRARGGQNAPPAPKNAKGSVKLWMKDGVLAKYELTVSGTMAFGQNQEERDMSRTTTVEIKNVGQTKFEVPAEVKTKLAS